MKLNLPSTWTSQKIASLFLLTFLKANRVKSGQAFNNCLTHQLDTPNNDYYKNLLNFDFANSGIINDSEVFQSCCDNDQCLPQLSEGDCTHSFLQCNKIAQNVFCSFNNGQCGGIVGNMPITTDSNLIGKNVNCNSYNISWLNSSLAMVKPSSSVFDYFINGYAQISGQFFCLPLCSSNLTCNWDNGGWTCSDYGIIGNQVINDCFFQWPAPWPGSTNLNPYTLTSTISNSDLATATLSTVISPSVLTNDNSTNSPNLIEIIVPAGTAVGAGSIGGLTYYLIKKKKKTQQQEEINQNQAREIPLLPIAQSEVTLSELPRYSSLSLVNEINQSETKNSFLNTKNINRNKLLTQIKNKLGVENQDLLDNFFDAQELYQYATDRNLVIAQRNFQRAKEALGQRISWVEMNALENSYHQIPNEYQAQVEVAGPSHRTGDLPLRSGDY